MGDLYDAEGRPLEARLTLRDLAQESGLSQRVLVRFLELGLIDPVEERPEPLFSVRVLPRVHRIQRLRRDLRVNLHGMGVVLTLLERVERLERELARFR